MFEKLKSFNWINIVFILLGTRAIVQSDIALALVVAVFAGLLGYRDYLKTKEVKPLDEEVNKRLDEMQTAIAGISIKNAAKPAQMAQELRTRFF